ncbi:hypothetical protein WMY93_009341 [Mugilogobius chulae]|uniref:Uncharacterized protein n=1 Tax=Mugilogobius chulae TaxID=88201 RepID=A0AAW0PQ10_9GOBI
MLAGKAYMERHNQVAGIVYRNICAEYGLETPSSKWETPPKVVENDRAKILWDFQIQTDRMVMANQPDIVVVDKEQRRAVVVDVAIPSDGNIRRKEHEKLEKYQGLREELEKAWKVKATVVPVVIGALGAVTPKLDEWLQHIPGSTSGISVQKSAVLGTARILRRTLKLPGLWPGEMSWAEEDWTVGLSGKVLQKVKELQVHHERLFRENKQKQLLLDNIQSNLEKQTAKYEEACVELQSSHRELQRVQEEAKTAITSKERLSLDLQSKQAQVCSLEGQLDAARTFSNKLTQEVKRLEAELEKLQNSTKASETTLFSTPCWSTSPWELSGSRKEERHGNREEGKTQGLHVRRLQFSDKSSGSLPREQPRGAPHRQAPDVFSTPSAAFPWERDEARPTARRPTPVSPKMPNSDDLSQSHVQQDLCAKINSPKDSETELQTLSTLQNEVAQNKKELSAKEISLQRLRDELSMAHTRISQEGERTSTAEQKSKHLQEELKCQRQNAESSRVQHQQRTKELEKQHQRDLQEFQKERQFMERQHQQEINKFNQELAQARAQHNALQAQLDKEFAQKQALVKDLDTLKEKLKWTEGQLQQSQKKEVQTQAKITEALRETEALTVSLKQSQKKERALEEDGRRLTEERDSALRSLRELQERTTSDKQTVASEDLLTENVTLRSELRDVREELQKRLEDLETQRRAETEARTRLKQLSRKNECKTQLEKERSEVERLKKALAALETERMGEAQEKCVKKNEEDNTLLQEKKDEMIELNMELKKQLSEVKTHLVLEQEERKRHEVEMMKQTTADCKKIEELEAEIKKLKSGPNCSQTHEAPTVANSPVTYLTLREDEFNSNKPESHSFCQLTDQRNAVISQVTQQTQQLAKAFEMQSQHISGLLVELQKKKTPSFIRRRNTTVKEDEGQDHDEELLSLDVKNLTQREVQPSSDAETPVVDNFQQIKIQNRIACTSQLKQGVSNEVNRESEQGPDLATELLNLRQENHFLKLKIESIPTPKPSGANTDVRNVFPLEEETPTALSDIGVVALQTKLQALSEENQQKTEELALWRLASEPMCTLTDQKQERRQGAGQLVTLLREDEILLPCSSNKLQGRILLSRLQQNLSEPKTPSYSILQEDRKDNSESDKENTCPTQHNQRNDTKNVCRTLGTEPSQLTDCNTVNLSSTEVKVVRPISRDTEGYMKCVSTQTESVSPELQSMHTLAELTEEEAVAESPTLSPTPCDKIQQSKGVMLTASFPIPADPARLAERIRRNRTQLSAAFDDTEYEPYGLPEVVMKGFADIPSGPSCPYIVRRGLLGTAAVPVLPKTMADAEETD